MRINKEIQTLTRHFDVEFVGLGENEVKAFVKKHPLGRFYFIKGKRLSPAVLSAYFARSIQLLVTRRYHSVHVINEPQLIVLWPFLWLQRSVILDIFDSIFLRNNWREKGWNLLKWLVYLPANKILVTDENRLRLLPEFLQKKSTILPNYPYARSFALPSQRDPALTILYFGWLGQKRGSETIKGLLSSGVPMKILMAGWLADDYSRELITHPHVEWHGTLPQDEALTLAATTADYLMCVYAPIHDNNINASPNKIYDAIQTRTPVIINGEVKVSAFVSQYRLGHVLPAYAVIDYTALASELMARRGTYHFPQDLIEMYTWEKVENRLIIAHQL